MTLSPDHGGGGQPGVNAILAIEELAKFSPVIATPVFESNIGPARAIDNLGTDEQKKALIPGVCKGELSVSVGMTEPEVGSDLTSLSTKLVEDGDGYLLNGRKTFISGGAVEPHLVYCPGDVPGTGDRRRHNENGMPASPSASRRFTGLRGMPLRPHLRGRQGRERVVVKAGEFRNLAATFDLERCATAPCASALPAAPSRGRPTPWAGLRQADLRVPGHGSCWWTWP
jgi:butyryl-CoA dehydrogenase